MGSGYLWIKAAHIIFVTSWFAGLFYLPRIYVNLATVEDAATRERLLTMARKLLRFTTGLAVLALAFGMWLLSYGVGVGAALDEREARTGVGADRLPRMVRHSVRQVRSRRSHALARLVSLV